MTIARPLLHGLIALCMVATTVHAAPADEPRVTITGFVVEGDNPLDAGETAAVLDPYRGEHSGLSALEAAADALEKAIRARGYSFHRVIVPPQTLAGDTLTLKVLRFTVGTIGVSGNQYFSRENVLRSLPELKSGQTPNTQLIARALAIGNEHPSKRTALTMREGAAPDTIDADVRVQDTNPQQLFAAVGNTGRRETGWYRATLGYQHGNLFDRDHALTVSYTTSPGHYSDVQQYGVNYWLPVYSVGGSLAAYYVYSDVDSGRVADFFQVSGRGEFFGARYTHAFPRRDNYSHKLAAAFDSRYFKNDVTFAGTPIGTNVGSRPVSLRYSGNADYVWGSAGFFAEYARNVAGGTDNNETAYAAVRGGAHQSWHAVRYGGDVNYEVRKQWNLIGRLRGQVAGDALIPGEQFGLGGAYSVRGFLERETAGDSGYFVNLEVWPPPLAGDLRLLAFVDGGRRNFNVTVPAQPDTLSIASAGAGVRWQWRRRFELAADGAYVLDGIPASTRRGDKRLHINVVFRF